MAIVMGVFPTAFLAPMEPAVQAVVARITAGAPAATTAAAPATTPAGHGDHAPAASGGGRP